MKRCPECRRDYSDDTLSFCLDDGERLVDGPYSEPATEILSDRGAFVIGPSEFKTAGLPDASGAIAPLVPSTIRSKFHPLLIVGSFVLIIGSIGYGFYRWTVKNVKPELSFQTAKFTRLTTSGKASGVAISPDGKYVVHVQDDGGQQSLWTRQVATQSNVEIVAPAARNYTGLSFSPDGDFIYYRVFSQEFSQGALFQVPTLGGTPKKLLENVSASPVTFSPDGKQFAFVRPAPGKESALMIANADGSGERKLLAYKNPPEAVAAPAWSPDGKGIAYVLINLDSNDHTIFEVQVADSSTRPLTTQRWLRVSRLTWLADGSGLLLLATPGHSFVFQIWHLVYGTGDVQRFTNDLNNYPEMSLAATSGTLAVVESETNASIWTGPVGDAASGRPVTSGSGKADLLPAWMPDGRIVYHSNAGGNNDIWITTVEGGTTPKQLTANARLNEGPTVSPDGSYIVFLSDRTGTPHIWRMSIDGGDQRQLTFGATGEQNPHVSPDGRWLVYRTSAGSTTIWKIPAEGGEPVQLSDKFSISPRISPDGKLLAYFFRNDNAPWRLAVASVDGGEPLKVFDVATPTGTPNLRWTPDGRSVAYTKTSDGVTNIVAQSLGGGPPKPVTDFKADRIFSFDYSRDGKQLALSRGSVSNDVVLISNFR